MFYLGLLILVISVILVLIAIFPFLKPTAKNTPESSEIILSGIVGVINYGPTTPACEAGESCDQPYKGNVFIDGTSNKTISTDSRGYFKVELVPGTYTLKVSQFSSCTYSYIKVNMNQFTNISMLCDTGIR